MARIDTATTVRRKHACITPTVRVRRATFADTASVRHAHFHEVIRPHRQPDCTAALRPRPGRVRPAVRRMRAHGLHPTRLIPARGDRPPRSPEATRTPSGRQPGGVLFLAFAKDPST